MATIVIFHSVLGLRSIEHSTAAWLRAIGHDVLTPDLFAGRTASIPSEGFLIMEDIGWGTIRDRARAVLATVPSAATLMGFSMGAGVISSVWPERQDAAAVILVHGLADIPPDLNPSVSIQAHVADPDPFVHASQLESWMRADQTAVQLFRYPGLQHFFTDPSLDEFDGPGANQVWDRIARFQTPLES
jgi:dienelactone hydrolase